MEKKTATEEQILKVAEEMFLAKGFNATSTSEIARLVGCNQALVHYYYRTKEKLFAQIFIAKVNTMLKSFKNIANTELPFMDRIKSYISDYYDFLTKNRMLPFFVLNELLMNTERRKFIRQNLMTNEAFRKIYYDFDASVRKAVDEGVIRKIEPLDLLMTIVSMVVFVFMSLPVYCDLLSLSEEERETYLAHKKQEVTELLLNSFRP